MDHSTSVSPLFSELIKLNDFKLQSHPWWILIPKYNTIKNTQQYFTDNYNQQNTSLNFTEIPCHLKNMCNKYAQPLAL